MRGVQPRWRTAGHRRQGRPGCHIPERSCLEIVEPAARRVQRLFHLPVTRARVRLPKIARNRGENQQDQMAPSQEPVALSAVHQRQDDKAVEGVGTGQTGRGV
uniref:(northern house mosquito) hypothetical protein n=1 Tax=Culex pipiens TaxID=7175 RepID=A0A8D8AN26_CULPI